MRSFKAGDRVAVYDNSQRRLGTVSTAFEDLIKIRVIIDGTEGWQLFHIKQCRKLVKKERREIYFELTPNGDGYSDYKTMIDEMFLSLKPGEKVFFKEVRRRKK